MFWRKKVKDNPITDTEAQRRVLKAVIDGKLYDTSKAKEIGCVVLSHEEIPNYNLPVCNHLWGQEIIIYKGDTEWFITYLYMVQPVTEEWVKEKLGKYNTDKYIELFGAPELA